MVLREQGATRQLVVTRVERDDALLDVMEPQLLDFYAEAKEDVEPFPIDSIETARLRLALRVAREEHVGAERVHEASHWVTHLLPPNKHRSACPFPLSTRTNPQA